MRKGAQSESDATLSHFYLRFHSVSRSGNFLPEIGLSIPEKVRHIPDFFLQKKDSVVTVRRVLAFLLFY
jgi:hypothetical protein